MRSATPLVISVVVAVLLAGAPRALAQTDHTNLEEGFPTRLEDAYPLSFRDRELQIRFSWDRTGDHKDRFTLQPQVELGLAPNWQFTLGAPFYLGDADRRGSGDLQLGALYNFNQESLSLPAFALSGKIDIPTGKDSEGVDTTLKFIMTKTVDDDHLGRIHLNLEWGHNFGAHEDERDNTFAIIPGYSFRLNADTIVVADFIREWEMERGRESNNVEVGARYQLSPRWVLSGGVGFGIGDDSPDARLTFGAQWSF
ncbi:MAG: transporter [Planctomycetes bacterium]|nr:transporter [Planctomycetota bacterium]